MSCFLSGNSVDGTDFVVGYAEGFAGWTVLAVVVIETKIENHGGDWKDRNSQRIKTKSIERRTELVFYSLKGYPSSMLEFNIFCVCVPSNGIGISFF